MLVDDDVELTDILHDYLEDKGLLVTKASSARQALYLLKHSGPYDLVLLDIGLPDQDGLSVLERLRLEGYDLPVVMATAESNSLKVRRARQLGVSAYLLKPFDLDRLVQIVDRLLAT
ncbi:MAG: response regulator [Anaerolineae bacterium]